LNGFEKHISGCSCYLALTLLWLCCLLPGVQAAGAPTVHSGQPTQLLSGDRLIFLTKEGRRYRVKLMGVKAPPPKGVPGAQAQRYLGSLVMGRFLTLTHRSTDAEGYLIGKLSHGGADVNIRMILAGLAVHDPQGQTEAELIRYAEAQHEAQRLKLGIWKRQVSQPRVVSPPGGGPGIILR
jgi:endonuclease YncB( thermonuclease family)